MQPAPPVTTDTRQPPGGASRWRLFAYTAAVISALSVGHFVIRSPLQINDCVDNMLDLQRATLVELFANQCYQLGYMRPMLWAALKVAFDAWNGHCFEMYKAIRVLQLL